MSKRVTIMMNDEIDKKIRIRQAKVIQKEKRSYSYSKALEDILRQVLK